VEKSILEGVRVLDFGRVLSAPYGTLALADLGADVVKVEQPGCGDDTRSFGPPFVDGVSTYFLSVNRGKRSVTADLKVQNDIDKIIKLANVADVIVENFRPGFMTAIGLGATEIMKKNPRLIYCSLSGFGQSSDKPGYDLMVQGLSGIPSITGPTDGAPYKCGASIADLVAGMNVTQSVLAALYRRERTGEGAFIDVSMIDGQISLLTYHASAYLNANQEPKKMGNGHPSIHPFQPYEVKDGYLNLCVGNDRIFARFSKALLHPEWSSDKRFQTNPSRVRHREELDALIKPILKSRTIEEWKGLFASYSVPADGMLSISEALTQHATTVTHPHPKTERPVQTLVMPYQIDRLPRASERRSPLLGEHDQVVWNEWLAD
jgi:crotonobetainyl-CoA:carnitine CoA-transferase CaiB-like acyl-CoA transferase